MKLFPIKQQRVVTLNYRNEPDKKLLRLTDEGDGNILLEMFDPQMQDKPIYWVRCSKELYLSMIVSLWPDEVDVVQEDDD